MALQNGFPIQQELGLIKLKGAPQIQTSPFRLAICTILCKFQLHHIIDSYRANNLDQLLVCGPLGSARWKREKCQELHV